jgi:AraC-like DNA-binding protein
MQFGRYQKLVYGSEAELILENQSIKIVWPLAKLENRIADECLVSIFVKIANSLTEQKLMPLEVGFRQQKPTYAKRFEEIFGTNVKFGCKQTYISYPNEYFFLEIKSKDKNMQKVLQQQAKMLLSHFTAQDEFEQKLNTAMISSIQLGQANLETVSRSLNTSARTLQRQLSERDTSFNTLLTIYRQELSQQYLKDKNLSLTDISFLLGYAEQSVFTRAFKSWYGITPKEFRNQLT